MRLLARRGRVDWIEIFHSIVALLFVDIVVDYSGRYDDEDDHDNDNTSNHARIVSSFWLRWFDSS